ncbi:MAG: choice-of-anchor tandem repeat GloVer-containing protein [Candidatus Sulfotelmatobacter sp.]
MTKLRTDERFPSTQRNHKKETIAKLKLACVALAFCLATAIASPAQSFTTIFYFNGDNGYGPGSLVQGFNGNLYGTTGLDGPYGVGTVFEISPDGTQITLYNFCSQASCTDGEYPSPQLLQASNGALYGTTQEGGAYGYGTIFELTPAGKLTTLYNFCSQANCTDGAAPRAGLVQTSSGNFYGTTYGGGANGWGTVFKITSAGVLTTLYSFCSQNYCPDGYESNSGLIQATNGNFYGTLADGGANGYGTVFEITPAGVFTTLHSFCAQARCVDGGSPYSSLVQASNGKLYGTTPSGGAHYDGTVFEITTAGKFTRLYSFCSQTNCTDGEFPQAGLIQATDGNFYGATFQGGSYGAYGGGTVFQLTPAGHVTTLYSYCDPSCNSAFGSPYNALMQSTNGFLYGTTGEGPTDAFGTVFSLGEDLTNFVETLPTSGKVGASVTILGNFFTGATSVTFNGTPATFTIVSSTEIRTTVPSGATTGTVQVTGPAAGTLNSNLVFRVTP